MQKRNKKNVESLIQDTAAAAAMVDLAVAAMVDLTAVMAVLEVVDLEATVV